METISFESIIASLILLGFEKVDNRLINSALDVISMGEDFELEKNNDYLLRYVIVRENNVFKLRNNLSINGNISINNQIVSVRKILEANTNDLLMDYLDDIKEEKKVLRK